MTAHSDKIPGPCPLCRGMTTTSICANCAEDCRLLGVDPPDPEATPEEVRVWARINEVSAFACGKTP